MTGLPSSQMFKPCGCTFRMLCWEHSRKFVHASSVDGHTRENRSRPSVNPDRHARIRARHFHHASGHAWTCSVLSALVPASFARFCDLSMVYDKAFENCAWGVS